MKENEKLYKFLKFIFYIPICLLMPTKVVGKENLLKEGRVILACNHMTFWDPVLLVAHTKRKINFVGKKEIFKSKFARWFFNKMGVIEIDRENLDLTTIKKIIKVLKDDEVLGIFPEGTRNRTNEILLPFKEGTTMFAERTDSPIIPIIIEKKPKLFRRNKIIIGEPLKMDKGKAENTEKLRNIMLEIKKDTVKEKKK